MPKEKKSLLKEGLKQFDSADRGSVMRLYLDKIGALVKKAPIPCAIVVFATAFALMYVLGWFEIQYEGWINYGPGNIIAAGLDGYTLFFVFLLEIPLLFLYYILYNATHSGQVYDEKRQLIQSEYGTSGTAKEMDETELEKAFLKGTFDSMLEDVIGRDMKSKALLAVKSGYGINGNYLFIGSPGSGKSRCIVIPNLFQIIRRGESAIVADPKGELYGQMAECAKAHGYTVKIFNTNPDQLMHSDGIDFMKIIGDNEFKIDAFVETIMANISDSDKQDFWEKSQMNELKFVTTFIAVNDLGIPKTLGGIYNFINTHSVEALEDLFFNLPDDHPAKPAFNTWAQGDKTVKGNTHAGLQIDLQRLSNKLIQKITGTDEIDLTLPGKKPCMYFISMNDQEKSMQWLTALYFTFQFKELVGYADSLPERKLPIKTTFVLDEFYNLGVIPGFDNKISQLRSRGIDCKIFIQSLGQLKAMYPDDLHESIIDCCSTMCTLATRSLLTAKYISEYSGIQTAISKGTRTEKLKGTEDGGLRVMETTSEKDRNRYNPDEVIRKDPNTILVSTSTFNMLEVEKVDQSKHPMNKEMRKVVAAHHRPEWTKTLDEYEKMIFKVENEVYEEEGLLPITLCTEEDFMEEWNDVKEAKLQKQIINDKKRLGIYVSPEEEEKINKKYKAAVKRQQTEPEEKEVTVVKGLKNESLSSDIVTKEPLIVSAKEKKPQLSGSNTSSKIDSMFKK